MQSQQIDDWMPCVICLGWRKTPSDKSLRHKSSHHVENRLCVFIRGHGARLRDLCWAYPPATVKGEREKRIILIIGASGEATVKQLEKEKKGDGYREGAVVVTGPHGAAERIADLTVVTRLSMRETRGPAGEPGGTIILIPLFTLAVLAYLWLRKKER